VPRRYTLGKRGEAKIETRERIVAAAIRLYQEVGFGGATVPAIARAADVAPATVRNHFPGPNDLAEATADAVLADLAMPDASIFAGIDGANARVRRLVTELAAFYERGTAVWQLQQADRALREAWSSQEARYQVRRETLIRAALAPHDDDTVAVTVTNVAVETMYFALRAAGQSSEAVVETLLEVLTPWLDGRFD